MELNVKITAIQLKKGDERFANQPVKNKDEAPFALVPYQGALLKVDEGNWLVEYHDGTMEVWNTEQITANTNYPEVLPMPETSEVDEDVRADDETPGGDPVTLTVTAQDLIDNPSLAEQGLKEGDTIDAHPISNEPSKNIE